MEDRLKSVRPRNAYFRALGSFGSGFTVQVTPSKVFAVHRGTAA